MKRHFTIPSALTLLCVSLLACGKAEEGAVAPGEPRDPGVAMPEILRLGEPRFGDFDTMVKKRARSSLRGEPPRVASRVHVD